MGSVRALRVEVRSGLQSGGWVRSRGGCARGTLEMGHEHKLADPCPRATRLQWGRLTFHSPDGVGVRAGTNTAQNVNAARAHPSHTP
eukprot:6212076-Pleurochrysis_carterae.AAC.4